MLLLFGRRRCSTTQCLLSVLVVWTSVYVTQCSVEAALGRGFPFLILTVDRSVGSHEDCHVVISQLSYTITGG